MTTFRQYLGSFRYEFSLRGHAARVVLDDSSLNRYESVPDLVKAVTRRRLNDEVAQMTRSLAREFQHHNGNRPEPR